MRPVLLTWRGRRIYSYPAFLYLGLVSGTIAGDYVAHAAGLNATAVVAAIVILTIPALAGARLLFVATHWPFYRQHPDRIWRRGDGGAALQGGLLLSIAVSIPLVRAIGLPFYAFWDVATYTMLTGLVFTRVGCLLHGCCSGRPADGPLTLHLPDHRGVWRRRVPIQLIEASWAALWLIAAMTLWPRRQFTGAIFLATLVGYAALRLSLEPMRDEQDRLAGVNVQRAFSAAVGAIACLAMLIAWIAQG